MPPQVDGAAPSPNVGWIEMTVQTSRCSHARQKSYPQATVASNRLVRYDEIKFQSTLGVLSYA